MLLSPFTSTSPDGLNRVAEDHGFAKTEKPAPYHTFLSGYEIRGIPDSGLRVGAVWHFDQEPPRTHNIYSIYKTIFKNEKSQLEEESVTAKIKLTRNTK